MAAAAVAGGAAGDLLSPTTWSMWTLGLCPTAAGPRLGPRPRGPGPGPGGLGRTINAAPGRGAGGDAPWALALAERCLAPAPELDFVIGSVHSLPAYGWRRPGADPRRRTRRSARAGRSNCISIRCVRLALWGRFSVLGHLTLPLRYMNETPGLPRRPSTALRRRWRRSSAS